MIAVGTAGHIDHGKSAIVRRLTGTDPDRLPEEKARGMTIDLGFAFYVTPDGEDIALIDVPGHERFVRNMIAGAGGIDAVMLVIAADDGWMPQSEEHMQITRLLGVKHGWVVINKCDLVDSDWLAMLGEEVREKTAGSFLANCPVFNISAETGQGFDDLRNYLDRLPAQISKKRGSRAARLFVDRSFVRPGAGGVVTGTLRGGNLSVGQRVAIWPSGVTGKVRSLHSKNESVSNVTPGQRTAVSFTGIEKNLLERGGVVTDHLDVTYFRDYPVLALSVELLSESPVPLEDRRQITLMIGTSESEGEVRIFDRKSINPAENGIVFFRPRLPMYALIGDYGIIRLPTPLRTLGGCRILDHFKSFPKRKQLDSLAYLQRRSRFTVEDLVISDVHRQHMVDRDRLLEHADVSPADVRTTVNRLVDRKALSVFNEFVFEPSNLSEVVEQLLKSLEDYLREHPHFVGVSAETTSRLSGLAPATISVIFEYLVSSQRLTREKDLYNLSGRGVSLKGAVKSAHEEIMKKLHADPYAPPTLNELASGGKSNQQAIGYLIESGEGHKCGSEFIFLRDIWLEVIGFMKETIQSQGELRVAHLRDRFGFSRKYAIPILEETDRIGLTERKGDVRVKGRESGDEARSV